jgi:tetratricopeptide (TPR) repeat protein
MWEAARRKLKNMRRSGRIPAEHLDAYRAQILLGLGRYEKVVELGVQDISLALAHARLGSYEKALRIAREAVRQKRPGAELALGEIHSQMGDLDEALRCYESGVQRLRCGGSLDRLMRGMGRTLAALGDDEEARPVFEQAIRRSRYLHVEDLQQLVECYRRLGDEPAAKKLSALLAERGSPDGGNTESDQALSL